MEHGRADEQVQPFPVGPPAAPLDLEAGLGALGGGGPAQVGQHRVVPGVGQLGDGAVQQLGLGTAEQLAEGAVDAQEAAVQADQAAIPMAAWSKPRPRSISPPLALPHSDEWVVHRV